MAAKHVKSKLNDKQQKVIDRMAEKEGWLLKFDIGCPHRSTMMALERRGIIESRIDLDLTHTTLYEYRLVVKE